MPYPDTLALLREALDLLNDQSNFGLRRDPHQTSYNVASRIEAHVAGLEAQATHPAIDVARRLWSDDHHVQVDQSEQEISEGEDGIWVRAWLLVEADDLPDDEPDPPAAGGEKAIKRAVTGKRDPCPTGPVDGRCRRKPGTYPMIPRAGRPEVRNPMLQLPRLQHCGLSTPPCGARFARSCSICAPMLGTGPIRVGQAASHPWPPIGLRSPFTPAISRACWPDPSPCHSRNNRKADR